MKNVPFGGVTNFLQSIERLSERALKAQNRCRYWRCTGKAVPGFQGKIGKQTKTIVETGLTLQKKIALYEVSVDDQGLKVENPPSDKIVDLFIIVLTI